MPVPTHNGAVILPDPPDWRQPLEWSRGWDTQVEAALNGAEARIGTRPKPREQLRFRLVPDGLAERLRLVQRLRAAAKIGVAIVPHWGRSATLASEASGTTLVLEATAFLVEPGDLVFVHDGDAFEIALVSAQVGLTITLASALLADYPAGAQVRPTIEGRVTVDDIESFDDWHQTVTVAVHQLRTGPTAPPVIVIPDPGPPGTDYWLLGAPVPRFELGATFDHWLDGAPIIQP